MGLVLGLDKNVNTRICIKCKRSLPLDKFVKDPHRREGRRNECQECKNAYAKEQRRKKLINRLLSLPGQGEQFFMASEADLAYMAGIIDGEGTIAARNYWAPASINPSVVCRLRVFNTNRSLIDWIAERWPGRIYHSKAIPNQKIVWTWETKGLRARHLALQVLPYLKIKRRQAEILIELIPLILRVGTSFQTGVPEENVEKRNKLVAEIRELNKRGVVSIQSSQA